MRKLGTVLLPFAFLALVFSSCKSTRSLTTAAKAIDMPTLQLLDSCFSHSKYDYLSAKINVDYKRNDDLKSFTVRARLKKDSAIWLSVSPAMGIEVFRLCISLDSVKILNRMEQKYFNGTMEEANELLKLNEDFRVIQALLTGMFIKAYDLKVYSSRIVNGNYEINADLERATGKKASKKVEQQTIVAPGNWRILSSSLIVSGTEESIRADYSAFQSFDTFVFPTEMSMKLEGKGKMDVKLSWSKVELPESLDFPFSISEKYVAY